MNLGISMVPLVPGTDLVPGPGGTAEPIDLPLVLRRQPITAHELALQRAITTPDYHRWLSHVLPAAGCTRPIRLSGEIVTVEADTGRLLARTSTQDMPDGVIYKACGTRRATVCPSCAETYRRDAFELIRTGLVGGKGVPESVARHPAVFVTLTAPSFGVVHTTRMSRAGTRLPCHPRRQSAICPHGVDLRCHRTHRDTDPALGTPLCLDCYDYPAQVIWNHLAGELWRRTRIAIDRALGRIMRSLGLPAGSVRLRYVKVAEMQRRGVVHFHAITRLDGRDPADPTTVLPPPPGVDVDHLTEAIRQAVEQTSFTTNPHPVQPGGWQIAWGQQLDIRPLRLAGNQDLTETAAAGYLAKYSTKAAESTGHTSRRLTDDTIDLYANPHGNHPERLVDACWTLGAHPDWRGLRRWAHMLGFGGHFLTKARTYSVTFHDLRQRRVLWRHTTSGQPEQDSTLLINWLAFTSAGWKTAGDVLLANTAAALARERQRVAREELLSSA